MLYTASYTNIETLFPGIDTNPANINPGQQEPTSFTDQPWNGGTTIAIDGSKYSAGLSKRVVPLPTSISAFTFTYQIRPSQTAALYSQVHETDLIIVDPLGNRYNGSCQKNNEEGGMWQIVNAAGDWVDTGFKIGLFTPDVWTTVTVIFKANWQALTLSVTSISDGTLTQAIPSSLQNIPATQKSGWQPSILDVQIQDGLNALGGGYSRDMRNIGIEMQ